MKSIVYISLGTLILCTSSSLVFALNCPQVQDVLKTTRCVRQATNQYKCDVNHPMVMQVSNQKVEHGRWVGSFESQVDVTQNQGSTQLLGHHGNNTCSYQFQNPTTQVNYDVTYR